MRVMGDWLIGLGAILASAAVLPCMQAQSAQVPLQRQHCALMIPLQRKLSGEEFPQFIGGI